MKASLCFLSFSLFLVLSSVSLFAEDPHCAYHFPESAAVDPQSGRTYITNFTGNQIFVIDRDGQKSLFLDEIPQPLGTLVEGGLLYCVMGQKGVRGFRLEDGAEAFAITIDEAVFLNDLTSDTAGSLYVTDSETGRIHHIDLAGRRSTVLYETGFEGLNGIFYDHQTGALPRLVFCGFSARGEIGQYDLSTHTFERVPFSLGENLDGITADERGLYFSSWGPGNFGEGFGKSAGKIYRLDRAFAGPKEVVAEHLEGPADIFYDPASRTLVIPEALGDTVSFLKLETPAPPATENPDEGT